MYTICVTRGRDTFAVPSQRRNVLSHAATPAFLAVLSLVSAPQTPRRRNTRILALHLPVRRLRVPLIIWDEINPKSTQTPQRLAIAARLAHTGTDLGPGRTARHRLAVLDY